MPTRKKAPKAYLVLCFRRFNFQQQDFQLLILLIFTAVLRRQLAIDHCSSSSSSAGYEFTFFVELCFALKTFLQNFAHAGVAQPCFGRQLVCNQFALFLQIGTIFIFEK